MKSTFAIVLLLVPGALFGISALNADTLAPVSTASSTAESVTSTAREATPADKPSPEKSSSEKAKPQDAKNGKNFRPLAGFTPEREAAALSFVRTNHPELADLLDRLKVRQPQEYQKAVRDLSRVSERLALSRAEFPSRYELELKQWKLTSRIQVLTARLSMGRTPKQEEELKQLLAEQLETHRELVVLNLERAKGRVAALSRELDDINSRKEAILEGKFEKAIKAAEQRKPAGKNGPAAVKKAESKSEAAKSE
jgi:hypothetical protein